MISLLAAMLLQAAAPAPAAAPPPPPAPPPVRAQPKASLGSLIGNDDYPRRALRNEEEGTVGFTLQVGTDGLVKQCAITSPSGSAALDSATCDILTERARFTPALDRRGKPMVDTVASRIIWRIEGSGASMPLTPMRLVITILIGPSGEATCTRAVNSDPEKSAPCPPNRSGSLIEVARQTGKEVRQIFVTTMTPKGQAEPPVPPDDGSQLMLVEASITASPNGVILECREVRAEGMGIAAGRPPPPGACGQFKPGDHLFNTNAPGDAPITMVYRARAYIVISG